MKRIVLIAIVAICGSTIELTPASADQDGPKSACQIEPAPANCGDYYVITVTSLVGGNSVPLGGPDPKCGSEADPAIVEAVMKVASNALGGNIAGAAGDLMNYVQKNNLTQTLINSTGGTVRQILERNGPRTEYAQCATMAALLPRKAVWEGGYRLGNVDIDAAAESGVRNGGCSPGVDCSNGFSRFLVVPDLVESDGSKAVWTQFANWSDRRRVGSLSVFFKMPQGAPVPHPM